MIRYEGHALSADRRTFERDYAPDPGSFAAFRVHVDNNAAGSLSTLIESEIIPRLMMVHAVAPPAGGSLANEPMVASREIEAFAPLVMQVEADELLTYVEAILARGVAFETLLVDLLAPTARLIGEYWEDDRCDFVDVTMGLWRLQEVVHELADRRPVRAPVKPGERRALFASMPGDQHSFGTVVIDELFRADGWLTDRLSEAVTDDLVKRAGADWLDLIGLTVSCDCHIASLAAVIAALRNASRNPRVCVMVGGRIFSADPTLAEQVGADGTARDAKLALEVADRLVREREREAAACN